MSNFLPSRTFRIEFDGDVITGRLRPLTRQDLLRLSPYFKQAPGGAVSMIFADQMALADAAAELLPAYIEDFSGLTVDGRPAGLEVALEQSYFLELLAALIGDLFAASTLSAVKKPMSGAPSPGESPDSGRPGP